MPEVTWNDLVEREPRLDALLAVATADRILLSGNPGYCAYKVFMSPGARVKGKIMGLVGIHAQTSDPVLRSQAAYKLAYETIFSALQPCCEGCSCGGDTHYHPQF